MVRCDPILAADGVTTHQLKPCNLLCAPTQNASLSPSLSLNTQTEPTRTQKRCHTARCPSQHGTMEMLCSKMVTQSSCVRCSLAIETWEKPRHTQTCLWNKLLPSIYIAKLLLLWLLVVIYQLHSATVADFNNYSSFTVWFHAHFIGVLLQHALYILYIPPAC